MNANKNKPSRTVTINTTVGIGLAMLIAGLAAGGAGAENGCVLGLAPKTAPATNQLSSPAASDLKPGGSENWNPFQQMRAMQAQMDKSFDTMLAQFQVDPQFKAFQDNPGYSLSLDVRDLKNRYVVRAYLPDAKASDVHVNLENGQMLNVEVNTQGTPPAGGKNAESSLAEWGQYEQMVRLPTRVKADQMKVSHEGHELDITLPKAA